MNAPDGQCHDQVWKLESTMACKILVTGLLALALGAPTVQAQTAGASSPAPNAVDPAPSRR